MKPLKIIFLLCFLQLTLKGFSQPALKEVLESHKITTQAEIENFYQQVDYTPVWMHKPLLLAKFLNLLASAHDFALNEKDYQYSFIEQFKKTGIAATAVDSIKADIMFTDAAIHFYKELFKGNRQPNFRYDGLHHSPAINEVVKLLHKAMDGDQLYQLAIELQPRSAEYLKMMDKYRQLTEYRRDTTSEEDIKLKTVSISNRPLMIKFYKLGLVDSVDQVMQDKEMIQKLRLAQRMFNLTGDGVLKPITLNELNVPVSRRVRDLMDAINYSRWLHGLKASGVAIVNIPSASLFVYKKEELVFDSKLIVGKPATPTPTLTSTINEVILYPYWNVPYKIATRELLPSIKRNRGYLAANNFQVLDKNGKVLNPYNINWSSLSVNYFPYTIRQSTGCDNSLGIVKFNFYNPFTVYLHDTPAKGLFNMNKRYFSHGCMRVEEAVEFGQFLLGRNRIAIDTLTLKGCLKSQGPKLVPSEEKLPVVIMYSTAWYDSSGTIIFFEDIYGRNKY